jgi:CO/xanthine dehydrogenase FAD-binding subunit
MHTLDLPPANVNRGNDLLLAKHAYNVKILAGRRSPIPMISLGLARPEVLIDIERGGGLGRLGWQDGLTIWAVVRHRSSEYGGTSIDQAAPLMATAAPWIGHDAILRRGTVVGSVALGDRAGVAAQVTTRGDGRTDDVRISLFGVDATPVRAYAAERVAAADTRMFAEAGHVAAGEARSSTDATASADHPRALIEVHVLRALASAFLRSTSRSPAA